MRGFLVASAPLRTFRIAIFSLGIPLMDRQGRRFIFCIFLVPPPVDAKVAGSEAIHAREQCGVQQAIQTVLESRFECWPNS